jgi:hypothetical protein
LIVDCDPEMQTLKEAAERYWWPRLIRNELDVVFIDEGNDLVPRPRTNADVQPFIAAWQNLDSRSEKPPKSKIHDFNRISTGDGLRKPGMLSCALLEAETRFRNTVALVRGPGMVVGYRPVGSDAYESCVGVFRADSDVEKVLTYSEPQTHNDWDENSSRLRRKFGVDGPRVVHSIFQRIERNFKDFQRLQEPPIPPGGLQPKELSKLLGRFLDVSGPTPPLVPHGEARPVAIHVHEDRLQREGAIFDTAEILLELKEVPEESQDEYVVSAYHEILGDASERVVERSVCTLEDEDGKVIAQGNPATSKLALRADGPLRLRASARSDEMFLTRIKVTVEKTG